jgi:DNA polymerase-3 subunit beta
VVDLFEATATEVPVATSAMDMSAGRGLKVTVSQENLHRALAQVTRAVATKTTLPVLNNILLSTDGGKLRLAATNLELAITAWVSCTIESEGAVTIPAKSLTEWVNTLPSENVNLSVDHRLALTLTCGRNRSTIRGIDAEDFPAIPSISDGSGLTATMDATTLKEMIAQVTFAAAADDSRPVLAGISVKFEGQTVSMSATDGFRLAIRDGELASPASDATTIIVPARALTELARVIGDSEEPVEMTVTPNRNQFMCRAGSIEFVSRLIEGTFPEVRQLLPKSYNTRAVASREGFLGAIRRANIFAREANDVVKLQITKGEEEYSTGTLQVSANAAEVGDNLSDVDASVEGPSGVIAFNVKYLSDVLTNTKSQQIALEMQGPNNAGVLRPVGTNDAVYVIMPMHLAQ